MCLGWSESSRTFFCPDNRMQKFGCIPYVGILIIRAWLYLCIAGMAQKTVAHFFFILCGLVNFYGFGYRINTATIMNQIV